MGGGGGMLNKLFPGYKDALWNKLPAEFRRRVIRRQSAVFSRELRANCLDRPARVQAFHDLVSVPLEPDYEARTPVVDYKRQHARGTLLPGRDMYVPSPTDQQRLYNPDKPYTEEELQERRRYARHDLKKALAVLFAGFLIYDYQQSRPVAWCIQFEPTPPRQPWYFRSIWHSFDVKSVRRGWEVFRQVCSNCHSLRMCKWWYLMKDVYPVRRVQEFAAEKTIADGVNDEGEVNMRPCMTWDYFPNPFPSEEAAKEANNGKVPPDFSEGPYYFRGGADYFFAILTGFRNPPVGVSLLDGTYYNPWFNGGVIGMSPPLEDGLVEYEDGTPATVSQMAKDVVNFLVFVSTPCHDEHKLVGLKAIIGSLLFLPCFLYFRRFLLAGVWNRRIDFDKLRFI